MGALEALAAVCAEELQSDANLATVDSSSVHSALLTGGGYLQNYQQLVQALHAAQQQQQTGPGGLRLQLPVQVQVQPQFQPQQHRAPVILHQPGRPTQPVIVNRPPAVPVPAAIPPTVTFRGAPHAQLPMKRPAEPVTSEARGKVDAADVRPPSAGSSHKPSAKPLIPGGPCENIYCGVTEAPQWRRIEKKLVCNRCGMYYHRHARFPDWSYFSGLANKNSTRHVVITHRGRDGPQQPQPQQAQVQILAKPPLPARVQQTPSPLPSPALSPGASPSLVHTREPAPVPQTLAQAAGPEVEHHEHGQAAAGACAGAGAVSDSNLSELLLQAGASANLEVVQRLLTTPVRQLDIDTIRKLQALLGERVRQQHQHQQTPPLTPSGEALEAQMGRQEPPASPQRGTSPGSPRSDSTFAPPSHAIDSGAAAPASGRGSAVADARPVPSGPARSPLRTPPSSLLHADSAMMLQRGQQPPAGSTLESPGSSTQAAATRAGVDSWEVRRAAAAEQRSPRAYAEAEGESASLGPEVHPVKRARMTPPPPAGGWGAEPARRVQMTSQAGLQQQVLLTHMLLQQQQQDQEKALRAAAAAAAVQQQQQRQAVVARQQAAAQRQAAVEEAGMLIAKQQQQRRAQIAQSSVPAGAGAAGRSLMETIAAAAALQQQQHGPSRGGHQEQQRLEQQQQERGIQSAMGGLLMRDLQHRAMLAHHHPHPQQQAPHAHVHPQHQNQLQQGGGQRRLSGSGGYAGAPQLRLVALDSGAASATTGAARAGAARGVDGGHLQQPEQGRASCLHFTSEQTGGGVSQGAADRSGGHNELSSMLMNILARRVAAGNGGSLADYEAAALVLAKQAAANGGGQGSGVGNGTGVAALLPVLDLGKPSAAVAF